MFHLSALIFLSMNHTPPPTQPRLPVQVTITHNVKPTPVPPPKVEEVEQEAVKKDAKHDIEEAGKQGDCKSGWYGGIGIVVAGNVITRVVKGYPADLVHLVEGDQIVEPAMHMIQGPIGSTFHMTLYRGGAMIEVDITRGKICYFN